MRNLGLATGYEIGPVAVAADDHDVLGAVEDAAATVNIEVDTLRNALGTLRLEATVEPTDLDLGEGELRHVLTGGEGELDHLSARAAVGEDRSRAGLDLGRIAELEADERDMHDVACHVTHGTGTEVPPAAEVPRMVDLIVVTHGGGSDEGVPVES